MGSARNRSRSTLSLGIGKLAALALAGCAPATAGTVVEGASASQAAVAASLVFDGVTVVDVEQGKLIPAQRVVITGNRIQAIGPAARVRVSPGAQVVEARGKYLIPGLWDMHVHPNSKIDFFYPLFIANGVTGIRDAWSEVPLDTLVQLRRRILAGTRVGPPRQLLAGGSFGQHYNNSDSVVVARIVDSLKAHGANFLKVYPYSSTVSAAARRAGLPFGGHMVYLNWLGGYKAAPESAIEASDSGMRIFDHAGVESKLSGFCFSKQASVERCRPIAERFRRNGSWWTPTMAVTTAYEGSTIKGLLAARARGFWNGTPVHGNWLRDSVHSGLSRDSLGFLYIAQHAGLPILAATDRGEHEEAPAGFLLHAELAEYVEQGLTPLNALQSATLNPAKLIHGTDSLGTVAPGKLADLVLLDANPLADITNTTAIRAVVANGRYFDRAALDGLLAEVKARTPRTP